MDSKQFLKEMLEVGYRDGDKPTSKTIAKVKFELGYSGFCKGHSMTALFRPYQEPGKSLEVKAAVSDHIKKLGGQSEAYLGVKYEVPAENIISFDSQYDKEHFVRAEDEEEDFKQIMDAIADLSIPLNEWVWVAYKSIDSPTKVAKGEKFQPKDGGEAKYRKIIVPVEKYADEQAAREGSGNKGNGATAADDSQWSDVARKNYPDINTLIVLADEVSEWYTKMVGGTPFANDPENFPLPTPLTPPGVKKQLAEAYTVETADIDILMSLDVTF
jgi:hypothetical protein